MKIRTDFVTNSSSSSYVIMTKENLTDEQLKQELLKAINMPSTGNIVFPKLGNMISETLTSSLHDMDIHEFVDDYYGSDDINNLQEGGFVHKAIYKYHSEYPYIKVGFVADDSDDPVELMLVDMDIRYKNENIIILKDGGY